MIIVDGIRRPISNTLGRRIAKSDTAVRNFWRWFGDSEMVDERGRPLVFYHTTIHDFQAFEVGRRTVNSSTFGNEETTRAAIFFTESPDDSNAYGMSREGHPDVGARTMPFYLRSENALNLVDGVNEIQERRLVSAGMSERFIYRSLGRWSNFDGEEGRSIVEMVRSAGYDSVIFNDENPNTGNGFVSVAIFDPIQIKSAIGNRGTFDPSDPMITNPGDKPWSGPDRVIRDRLFKNNDAYLVVDRHGLGDTWLAGGCAVAAEAIRRRFGGTLMGIWDSRAGLTHVVVERRGWLIDAEGRPAPADRFLRRYAKRERLVPPVRFEPYEHHQAERAGIVYDEEAVEATAALLR